MPQSRNRLARLGHVTISALLLTVTACGGANGSSGQRGSEQPRGAEIADGLDASSMPPSVRADYLVFATRCSKCHALARPLKSGIRKDADWAMLVDRMRRQEGSGISREDADRVLRFLHYYSTTNGT